ncbi:MAG: hypothetical protein KJ970_20425 [Candidatus Eisenbacteria bacterium]|uniref:Uncharacterized protein n=1 Tax=Eiseniibacteriota bacterium TaxID=2212470 RepID=A0A948RZK2_UNCEI|nr:hypothetical protein [Candidatus Eisenbacteria bacterium]
MGHAIPVSHIKQCWEGFCKQGWTISTNIGINETLIFFQWVKKAMNQFRIRFDGLAEYRLAFRCFPLSRSVEGGFMEPENADKADGQNQ